MSGLGKAPKAAFPIPLIEYLQLARKQEPRNLPKTTVVNLHVSDVGLVAVY